MEVNDGKEDCCVQCEAAELTATGDCSFCLASWARSWFCFDKTSLLGTKAEEADAGNTVVVGTGALETLTGADSTL